MRRSLSNDKDRWTHAYNFNVLTKPRHKVRRGTGHSRGKAEILYAPMPLPSWKKVNALLASR